MCDEWNGGLGTINYHTFERTGAHDFHRYHAAGPRSLSRPSDLQMNPTHWTCNDIGSKVVSALVIGSIFRNPNYPKFEHTMFQPFYFLFATQHTHWKMFFQIPFLLFWCEIRCRLWFCHQTYAAIMNWLCATTLRWSNGSKYQKRQTCTPQHQRWQRRTRPLAPTPTIAFAHIFQI